MVHTRSGVFRRFAFIGYSDQSSAQEAIKYFNGSYIGTSKVQVVEAKAYGDTSIPRPWSRYSSGSSANQERKRKSSEEVGGEGKEEGKKSKKLRLNETVHQSQLASLLNELEDLKSEPSFVEFLTANERGCSSDAWSNEEKSEGSSDLIKEKTKKRKRIKYVDETREESSQDEGNNFMFIINT